MSDADRFTAQDTAHDLCEVPCGEIKQGIECPLAVNEMEFDQGLWNEMQYLIAQYDWAVEGMSPPMRSRLTDSEREIAVKIRNGLVKLTGELIK